MSDYDSYCAGLIEQAKRFLEKAKETKDIDAVNAYLNSSLLISISALEAYLNGISSELLLQNTFTILEKSLLSEKDFYFNKGKFKLKNNLKMSRIKDRIEFIYTKYSGNTLKTETHTWWKNLDISLSLRNSLVHPKEKIELDYVKVEIALLAVIECINELYLAVYTRKFPKLNRGINSKYTF